MQNITKKKNEKSLFKTQNQIPLEIKIIKSFINSNQPRLTLSEIASYCNTSIQAIKYHINKMSRFLIIDSNGLTNKKYYQINDFFLHPEAINQLRDTLNPFLEAYTKTFVIEEDVTDSELEIAIINFLEIIAWLFVDENNFQ